MRLFYRLIELMILISLLISSCSPGGTPTGTAVPTVSGTAPPALSPTYPSESLGNPPLSLPDMYFVIDESESMTKEDSAGKPCDPVGLRYKTPLFIAGILKNWVDQGIANAPNLYLLLRDEQANAQVPTPIGPDQMIKKLTEHYSNPPKSNVQPFDNARNPDALQAVFDVAKNSDYVFLFSDGDFRKNRSKDDLYDSDAYSTSLNVANLFRNKPQHPKTSIFLLCTRRIESQNNWFIKDTWENLVEQQQATVDGLETPDLQDKAILSDLISKMLYTWLGNWNGNLEKGYATRGWGWFVGGDLSPVINVIPDLLRLRYGAISFDNGVLKTDAVLPPTIRLQIDTNAIPELDTGFPDRIDDFIPPSEQCSPHRLEFDQHALDENTFYWWWADVPIFSTEATQPIILTNNESTNFAFDIKVGSSLKDKGGEFLKSDNLDEFARCLSFYTTLEDKKFDLKYQDGKLLLENMINPFSDESGPLPNNTGIVPLTVQGNWSSNQRPLLHVNLLSQSEDTKIAKIRYYPVVKKGSYLPTITPTAANPQEIEMQIPLDFFREKYYPSSIFPNKDWQPTVRFDGVSCPLGLTTPIQPPYPPGGGLSPHFAEKTVQAEDSGLEISINSDLNYNFMNCKSLILDWNKWPGGIEDWKPPDPIRLECHLYSGIMACT